MTQTVEPVLNHGELDREARKQMFGIDSVDSLAWRKWVPGVEYVKSLVLKNVSNKQVKFQYKAPGSKAFGVEFPEPVKLMPGMSYALKVVFRPIKAQNYYDHIEIVCDNQSFMFPIEATIAVGYIEVTKEMDFGYVPVKETVQREVEVKNTGDVALDITWKAQAPFSIHPASASVQPGRSLVCQVLFNPQEATPYNCTATCQPSSGAAAECALAGIGKFPYLSVEQPVLDFGPVLVGKSVEQLLRFGNHSLVPANFTVAQADEVADGVFHVSPPYGTLGPEQYSIMRVVYTPKASGTYTSQAFSISTVGGNKVTFHARGTAQGPSVTLSTRSINFGSMAVGTASSRVLYLQNASDVPVPYEWVLDPHDVFAISKPRGTLPPNATSHVTLTCRSQQAGPVWRRVACVIKDAEPIGLDLLVTAYDDKSRPPPLTQRHVDRYLKRAMAIGQENLGIATGFTGADWASVAGDTTGAASEYDPPGFSPGEVAMEATAAPAVHSMLGPDGWQLLFEGQDPAKLLSLEPACLDFGACSRLASGEYKTVTLTNRSDGKLTAFIASPSWQDPVTGALQKVFHVLPPSADVQPQGQATFRVAFRPPLDGQFFDQLLQCVAFIKPMRNFRLLSDAQVVPPWSLALQATGNTFVAQSPDHSPKLELRQTSITFQPCRLGQTVCQTLCMANYGDTPIKFAFTTSGLGRTFAIKPAMGLIPAHSHQLLAASFSPTEARAYSGRALCVLNNMGMDAREIVLSGAAHLPRLAFDTPGATGTFFFRPTCLGASSSRSLTITNVSRVPLAYRFVLPAKLEGVVAVQPDQGVLEGNESAVLTWTFAPAKQKTYDARVLCRVYAPDEEEPVEEGEGGPGASAVLLHTAGSSGGSSPRQAAGAQQLFLHVQGEGTAGAVSISPASVDLGTLHVGYTQELSFTLQNNSDGVLRYKLDCCVTAEEEPGSPANSTPISFALNSSAALNAVGGGSSSASAGREMWVDEPEGTLAAKASKKVVVTLYPVYRRRYAMQLQCRTYTLPAPPASPHRGVGGGRPAFSPAAAGASDPVKLLAAAPPTCADIAAVATFPTVLATNVFCEGLPKHLLWERLDVKALNAALLSPVTKTEIEVNEMEDRGTLNTEIAARMLETFRLFLGTRPVGSDKVTTHVELTNTTALPVHWELGSYDAPNVELENWVSHAPPAGGSEVDRDFIVEHGILDWQPRQGKLAPGDSVLLAITFDPSHLGHYELPVFLHVRDGKHVCMLLRGAASQPAAQCLALVPSTATFTLAPVPIGEPLPPVQTYVLRNDGPGPMRYTLDLAPLQALVARCHAFPVIRFLGANPAGKVPAGGCVPLNWVFAPLEAREYSLELPILLGDGTKQVVTMVGRGYAPEALQLPPSLPGEWDREWQTYVGLAATPSRWLPGRLAGVSHDALSLGITLLRGVTRRLLVLSNTSRWPLLFSWDLGVLADESGALDGSLAISPAAGSLAPGEVAVCRLSYKAGLQPQIFEGEITCRVSVDEELFLKHYHSGSRGGAGPNTTGALLDGDEEPLAEGQEELIAADPPPPADTFLQRGSKLSERLPLHAALTTAAISKSETLRARHADTLALLTTRRLAGRQPPPRPPPQVICVTVSGRALALEQVQSGTCVPPHLASAAAELLQGAHWEPPSAQPFFAAAAHLSLDQLLQGLGFSTRPEGGEAAPAFGAIPEAKAWSHAAAKEPSVTQIAEEEERTEKVESTEEPDAASRERTSTTSTSRPTSAKPASDPHSAKEVSLASGLAEPSAGTKEAPQARPLLPTMLKDSALAAAGAVLQDVLLGVLADPVVAAAFDSLEQEQLPVWGQVRESALPEPFSRAPAQQAEAPAATKDFIYDPACQQLTEFVLEGALLSLMQESIAGDWHN